VFDLGLIGGWAAGGPVAEAGAPTAKSPAGAVLPAQADASALAGSFGALIDACSPGVAMPSIGARATDARGETDAQDELPVDVVEPPDVLVDVPLVFVDAPQPACWPKALMHQDHAGKPADSEIDVETDHAPRQGADKSANTDTALPLPMTTAPAVASHEVATVIAPAAQPAPVTAGGTGTVSDARTTPFESAGNVDRDRPPASAPIRPNHADTRTADAPVSGPVPQFERVDRAGQPEPRDRPMPIDPRASRDQPAAPPAAAIEATAQATATSDRVPAMASKQPAIAGDMASELNARAAEKLQTLPPQVRKALADAGHTPVAAPTTERPALDVDRSVKAPLVRPDATNLPVDSGNAPSRHFDAHGDREQTQRDAPASASTARVWGPVARYRAEAVVAPENTQTSNAAQASAAVRPATDARPTPQPAPAAGGPASMAPPAWPSAVPVQAPVAPMRAQHIRSSPSPVEQLPESTAQQIVQSLRLVWSRGGGDAHIRLDPRQFGDLSVSVHVGEGRVIAQLQSDTPAVREWLQANQQTLRQSLADHDLRLDRLDVKTTADEARDETQRDRREQRQDPDDPPARRPRRRETVGQFEIVA